MLILKKKKFDTRIIDLIKFNKFDQFNKIIKNSINIK